jgi:hypothetical protein
MHPTPTGKRMSQGLDGVRKAAKERKQERFSALHHHLKVDLLRDSFYALQIGLCIGLMIIGSALLFAWHKRLRSKVSLR